MPDAVTTLKDMRAQYRPGAVKRVVLAVAETAIDKATALHNFWHVVEAECVHVHLKPCKPKTISAHREKVRFQFPIASANQIHRALKTLLHVAGTGPHHTVQMTNLFHLHLKRGLPISIEVPHDQIRLGSVDERRGEWQCGELWIPQVAMDQYERLTGLTAADLETLRGVDMVFRESDHKAGKDGNQTIAVSVVAAEFNKHCGTDDGDLRLAALKRLMHIHHLVRRGRGLIDGTADEWKTWAEEFETVASHLRLVIHIEVQQMVATALLQQDPALETLTVDPDLEVLAKKLCIGFETDAPSHTAILNVSIGYGPFMGHFGKDMKRDDWKTAFQFLVRTRYMAEAGKSIRLSAIQPHEPWHTTDDEHPEGGFIECKVRVPREVSFALLKLEPHDGEEANKRARLRDAARERATAWDGNPGDDPVEPPF